MIYIEPATYVVDLIRVLRQEQPGLQLRVLYISASVSQPWESSLDDGVSVLLPEQKGAALKQILSEIRGGYFDWLHLAGWGNPLLMAALLAGTTAGRRISMESDTQLSVGQSRWKTWMKELLYPRLFAQVDLFLPGGTRQKDFFLHYGVPEAKIRTSQMTVDVAKIAELSAEIQKNRAVIRAAIGLSRESTVFVFVGRLEAYKGICLLLEAFRSTDSRDIQLLIVGDGSCRGAVEAAAGSDERIRYVGRREFPGVVEAFAISDVAVIPSSFEPWGLVVNEAMAAGLPVIASDRVGCIDDLVMHGKTGLVVRSGDQDELTAAMREMAESEHSRIQMGHHAQKRIEPWDLQTESAIMMRAWHRAV